VIGALAFLNIGFPEMAIILVLGLLIYGRRLPEVGAQVGKTVANLKRGLHEFKAQIDTDEDLRDVRNSISEVRSELRSIEHGTSRITADTAPVRNEHADLTEESLSSPGPDPIPGAASTNGSPDPHA